MTLSVGNERREAAATAAAEREPVRELDGQVEQPDPAAWPYLSALAAAGPGAFADNVAGTFRLIDAFGTVLPILVCEPVRRPAADICSAVGRYAGYPSSEAAKRVPRAFAPAVRVGFGAWGAFLRVFRMDRVVYVNNWLLSTNPVRALADHQYRQLNAWLRRRYPRHAIVHRTVNPFLNRRHAEALQAAGCRLVGTRIVYVVDTASPEFRRRTNVWHDERLLRESPYRRIEVHGADGVDLDRIASLYRQLYLDKHCRLNTAFNARFFERVLSTPFFHTSLFTCDGRTDAFTTFYEGDGCITGCLVGHDASLSKSHGLYRMALMYKVFLAEKRGLRVNLSGGCGPFKCMRGAVPVREYDAVDDRHLPGWRRLPWRLARIEGRLWRERTA